VNVVASPSANYINHIAVVADESYSMNGLTGAVVKVSDTVIAHLAERSRHYDQETRITYYTFSDTSRCLFYDKDVLRMPSIAGRYQPAGNTALIDTTMLAISDLEKTAQLYGDHAFLLYVFSDGMDNRSQIRPAALAAKITSLPSNWTIASFAPHQQAGFDLKKCGFPAGNIAMWDALTTAGVEEMGAVIRDSSDAFMAGREHGVRGYSGSTATGGLFRVREFTSTEVTSKLPPLTRGSYTLHDVAVDERIDEFTQRVTGKPYANGHAYYQFTKREEIQASKQVAVEVNGDIYTGRAARDILGLPDASIRISPNAKAGAVIFVQSTSYNRKLIAGTRLLLLR
jgi:hypothetical protein